MAASVPSNTLTLPLGYQVRLDQARLEVGVMSVVSWLVFMYSVGVTIVHAMVFMYSLDVPVAACLLYFMSILYYCTLYTPLLIQARHAQSRKTLAIYRLWVWGQGLPPFPVNALVHPRLHISGQHSCFSLC